MCLLPDIFLWITANKQPQSTCVSCSAAAHVPLTFALPWEMALQRQGIICSMHAVQALLAAEKDMAKLRGVANRAFESLRK